MTTQVTNSFISVIGSYEIDEQDVAAFARIATDSVRSTVPKQGCMYYTVSRDLMNPNVFRLAEGWASEGDLNEHAASVDFKAMLEQALKLRILSREIYISQSNGRTLMG